MLTFMLCSPTQSQRLHQQQQLQPQGGKKRRPLPQNQIGSPQPWAYMSMIMSVSRAHTYISRRVPCNTQARANIRQRFHSHISCYALTFAFCLQPDPEAEEEDAEGVCVSIYYILYCVVLPSISTWMCIRPRNSFA